MKYATTLGIRNLATPDEKRSFEHGVLAVANLPGATVAQATLDPGWRWSTEIQPLVGTESCQVPHMGLVISGRFHVRMDDGQEFDMTAGDAHVIPAGHDAWVVGDEPCVLVDIAATGAAHTGRVGRCPCGVEFRVATDDQLDHLIAAIQEHARGSHDHEVSREHILGELTGPPLTD